MSRKKRHHQSALQPRTVTAPDLQPGSKSTTVEAELAAAVEHVQAGRLEPAEAILTRVLMARPSEPVALHLLGVVALQAGNNETAVDLIGKAVALKPEFAAAHHTLGSALMNQGKHEQAAAAYQEAVALRPDYDQAYVNLGIAQVKQGKLDEAVAAFRSAVALAPNVAQAHNNLGSALVARGEIETAVGSYQRAIALNPDYAEAHFNLGYAFKSQGKYTEAVIYYRKAIALRPGYTAAHNNLGTAFKDLGRFDESVACYRKAIALKPRDAEVYSNLGNALKDLDRLDEAAASHQQAIALKPDVAVAHYNLGTVLDRQRKLEEAVACYSKAIALEPDYPEALNNLGVAIKRQGRRDEAAAHFRRAIEIRPTYFDAYCNHAFVHTFRPGDPEIDSLKGLLARADPPPDQKTRIHFALGKAHDDIGRYDEAFSYYSAANDEMAARGAFDPVRHRTEIGEIKEMFRERRVIKDRSSGDTENVPVFVVGMPRSGKTLVESLLAQHDDVYGGGESHEWWNAVKATLDKYSISSSFPKYMGVLSENQLGEIGEIYSKRISAISHGATVFINTMPGNDQFVGMLFQALPTTRIIYCDRNPMDNCVSMYFYQYKGGHDYTYDLRHLASYYVERHEFMTHWRNLYGDGILNVRYEDLVRDPVGVSARIFEFCGLDWDPSALQHGFTTDEIGHWKHYEPFLERLRHGLGDLARQT